MSGGAMLSGVVAAGANESSAVVEHVNLAPDDLVFNSEICRNLKATPQVWEPGPPVAIGINIPENGDPPFASATIANNDISDVSVLPPAGDETTVSVSMGVEEWEYDSTFSNLGYPIPASSNIALAFDGNSFSGEMVPCGGDPSVTYGWRGTIAPAVQSAAHFNAHADLQQMDVPLSLMDLLSQSTDGAVDIAKQKFTDFILYAMDDWRDRLFAVPKPPLSSTEQKTVSDNLNLYTQHVNDAFILKQLSVLTKDQGGPSDAISAADIDKIKYFWQRSLMNLEGYNDVSNRLTQISWINVNPRIQNYVTDNTTNWARQLFTALTAPHALNQAVLGFIASGFQLTQVNRNAELLLALSPTLTETMGTADNSVRCTMASLYHSKLMSRFGAQLSSSVTYGSPQSVTQFANFLPTWIQGVRANIAEAGKNANLSAGQTTMYQEIESSFAAAEQEQGGLAALATEISQGIAVQSGSNLFAKISNWTKLNPLGKKISGGAVKAINVAAFCYGLQNVIGAFKNWDNLTDAQKAQNVITTGELGINLLGIIADSGLPEAFGTLVKNAFNIDFEGLGEAISESLAQDLAQGEDFFSATVKWLGPDMEAPEKSAFTQTFESGARFMKGFAIVTAAAAVAFSAYKVYEDFDGHGQVANEVLDVLILTSNVVVLAGAIAAFAVGECLMASLGPVGAVLGVILAIVSIFLPSPPPDRPSDDYMNDRGNSVLASLPTPKPGWDQTSSGAQVPAAA